MAGLSVAYEALLKGRHVTVVDRGPIASGMTARTTAHLASALDNRYYEFIKLRGEEQARFIVRRITAAHVSSPLHQVEEMIKADG